MDLEEKLKSYPNLPKHLEEIKESCNKIWSNILLPWFTNHDVSHSKEIIHLLEQILSPIENTPQCLNEHEIFILLASAYLHDIGMQYLKVDDIPVDKLTSDEYELIRKRHAEESHDIILKRLKRPLDRDDFYLPVIEDDYLRVIAEVSKGHAADFFEEIIKYFQENPATPLNRPVRGELLTALLMIADELDLQNKRARFIETAKFNLSNYSAIHWYKHHYVDGVKITKGIVHLTLTFPSNADEYKELFIELIKTKLKTQIDKANPVFNIATSSLLHLDDIINIQTRVDNTKRRLPDEALKELKKILNKDTSIISPIAEKKDIIHRNIPRPTRIFTGRKDELCRFKEAFGRSNLISIEGLGGIGKTEFAAQCIELYLQQNNVIWFDCSPDSKLDSLIDSCGYSDLLKGESKTELSKYSGFADLSERDKLVIFLDNFQDVMDDSFKNYFRFSERRLRNAKFVLIAREHPSLGMVHVVPVSLEGLKNDSIEYAKKVINVYYPDVVIDDVKLENVCEAVGGHPLSIDLAIQLIHYGETPHEIVRKFIEFKDRSEELSHRLLDEIFNHPKSTKEERELLLNFSIFRAKVEKAAYDYISDDPKKINILHKLMDKQLIKHYGDLYGSHPLVREFCYHRLEDKKGLHMKASAYLKTRRKEKLDPLLEEEIFYHLLNSDLLKEWVEMISEKGEEFILSGYTNSLKEMMDKAREKGIEQAILPR
ncbi:MAG TPA: HD domain-containing protein [Candidatus Wunengus sp. YC61]|uniref:HD domain-containing protein n=1 Tax=Candidatus Wunengus sp. YC61 TaxID=3367698 RepID=UPI004026783F